MSVQCGSDHKSETIIMCDDCDQGYHFTCLNPPLQSLPCGMWLCPDCKPKPHDESDSDITAEEIGLTAVAPSLRPIADLTMHSTGPAGVAVNAVQQAAVGALLPPAGTPKATQTRPVEDYPPCADLNHASDAMNDVNASNHEVAGSNDSVFDSKPQKCAREPSALLTIANLASAPAQSSKRPVEVQAGVLGSNYTALNSNQAVSSPSAVKGVCSHCGRTRHRHKASCTRNGGAAFGVPPAMKKQRLAEPPANTSIVTATHNNNQQQHACRARRQTGAEPVAKVLRTNVEVDEAVRDVSCPIPVFALFEGSIEDTCHLQVCKKFDLNSAEVAFEVVLVMLDGVADRVVRCLHCQKCLQTFVWV